MALVFAKKASYRLIQISDCHLVADPDGWFCGVQPYRQLELLLSQLQSNQPDAVLLTGDLTQDHSLASYQLISQLFSDWSCPVFYLPGNHDDMELMQHAFASAPFCADTELSLGDWRLCLLNSKGPTPAGYFDTTRQQQLQQQLQQLSTELAELSSNIATQLAGITSADIDNTLHQLAEQLNDSTGQLTVVEQQQAELNQLQQLQQQLAQQLMELQHQQQLAEQQAQQAKDAALALQQQHQQWQQQWQTLDLPKPEAGKALPSLELIEQQLQALQQQLQTQQGQAQLLAQQQLDCQQKQQHAELHWQQVLAGSSFTDEDAFLAALLSDDEVAALQQLQQHIRDVLHDQLQELLPSYASLLIVLKPEHKGLLFNKALLEQQLTLSASWSEQAGQLVVLPVYYHNAWDLAAVAQRAGLSTEQVIELHQAMEYRVYAIGFAPGFAYLGELDARLATPRLKSPRAKVPKGAVAIADRQTAVYPAESPGGWNILGLCPIPLFKPEHAGTSEALMPFSVGDRVRFQPVSQQEFLALGGQLPQELC